MKAKNLKKDKGKLKGKVRTILFYSITGAIIIFALFLFLLEKYSPLEEIYLYLISFAATVLIVYPLVVRKVSSIFDTLFKPLERDVGFVESLIEGKYEATLNFEDEEFLQELSEKLSVLGETLKNHLVAIKDSLFKLQEIADARDVETLKEEISALLRNLEDSFKVD